MIVVVESNFVFELAFRREEVDHAERMVALASKHEIELVVPACALFEPFEALVRRMRGRNQMLEKFREQIAELGRSAHFSDLNQAFEGVARALAKSVETERAALDSAIRRILDCSHVIALSAEILRSSFPAREQFSFEPQDSVIFASADWYLNQGGRRESVFANKNSKDFAIPAVEAHFAALNCKVLSTFADALGWIGHRAKVR